MKPKQTISVSKLAFYAEDPARLSAAKGKAYNAKAAALGEAKHNAIGRAPSKLLYAAAVVVAVLVYLWMTR
ncbi:TPA: hypothetical protein NIA45_006685 [Pseudomonas aeruginosa]|nr:hypothetical protein [Pseudomonas aeruginosa]